MAVIVQKYGGSSVADVAKIGEVAARIVDAKRAGDDVVVVVSAMGKTTDGLLELARSAAQGPTHTVGSPGDPPRRELDMLVSTGERVSMALLSIAIQARGHEAISFTGSQSGIMTTDRHFDARITEVRPHRIEEELALGKIVIVAGYQGMSERREITTLGRGGSDTTAVALAAALSAERCEIYSDVDGVYTADPRVVASPEHLPEIDLAVMQEMAEAGAKVLNAQAVEWARRAGIKLHARKTSDARGPGAVVRETIAREGCRRATRSIVGMDKVVELGCRAADFGAFATIAAKLDLPLIDVVVNAAHARASVPLLNLPDWETRREVLVRAMRDVGAELSLVANRAIVSVVGSDVTTGGEGLPRFLAALARAGIDMESLVATPLRIGAAIASDRLADAQRALHAAFVEMDN